MSIPAASPTRTTGAPPRHHRISEPRHVDGDPPPLTDYEVVDEGGLLRLRYYAPEVRSQRTPIVLVYALLKRPYILDLQPDRSIVRNFLRQGFPVYLTDWIPPARADAWRGFEAYVNQDLARAIDCIRSREQVEGVSLVGYCFGGLLAVVYAALHPESVAHLVVFALPFELRASVVPQAIDSVTRAFGNCPAWLIRAGLTALVPSRFYLPLYLSSDLGEPELARPWWGSRSSVERALQPWMESDVPMARRVFSEVMKNVFGKHTLAEGRFRVNGERVNLERIRCPVLSIIGERDRLVPPTSASRFVERVGSRDASNLVFPVGHLGLAVGLSAHRELWPQVGAWLNNRTPN